MSEGKVAVVTGGSRGIGAAIALKLAADGATVAVHYGRDEAAAEEIVKKIEHAGGNAFAIRADLATEDGPAVLWAEFDEKARARGLDGKFDVLVNNAGTTVRGVIEDTDPAEFDRQLVLNVRSPFFVTRLGLARQNDGGRIINISSGATRIALTDIIGYSATKGAIDAFTFTLAKHLGTRKITVNAVAPGIIDTDLNAAWLRGNDAAQQSAAELSALGRVGQPSDVAEVVGFLASDASGWVTGQIIDATGGSAL
ncbi:SDR family oxidoreductase [Lentzea aerocolonigenes]|uniref:SDR family oxidoreductase n=1 Tax=Lentzea aerocolonigenes TaxID=68170 RepID=UPI000AFC0364|nr:SDR family oxidoreductase [Lentzea aerocolonigenes]MCP2243646.1 3-oxoacyl-[acyl-carrier protein] reductase [Lentzea aerocolonigenes]